MGWFFQELRKDRFTVSTTTEIRFSKDLVTQYSEQVRRDCEYNHNGIEHNALCSAEVAAAVGDILENQKSDFSKCLEASVTPKKNLLNQSFGNLVVKFYVKRDNNQKIIWKCACSCGNFTLVRTSDLTTRKVNSCGCLKKGLKKNVRLLGSNHKNWKGYGEISGSYLRILQNQAKVRGIVWNVTPDYLWELFVKQNRKCALSGIDIFFTRRKGKRQTASLDRIDSNKDYIEGNVQWVHKKVNNLKGALSEDILYNVCRAIYRGLSKRKYGKLWGSKCYLIGNLQNSDADFVKEWRANFSSRMRRLGIITMSPLDKVFVNFDTEDTSFHKILRARLEKGKFEEVHKEMQAIRRRDLAMVDHSNFIVGVLDVERPTYGTVEELSFVARANKPLFLVIKQGVHNTPFWLIGMFKAEVFFNSLEEVTGRLEDISSGKVPLTQEGWRVFDDRYILPQ
jgi:hypothetical protein